MENPRLTYAAGFRARPALLVRGSSRRITIMRFRPANIRVINRRVCSWAVVGPAVPNETRSKLTSGNVFPLRRPSTFRWMPEWCSQSRVRYAAPKTGAPLTAPRRSGQTIVAMGGAGGNTSRVAVPRQKAGFPAAEESRLDSKKICQALTGLDRVAPYQKFNRSDN